MKSKIFVFIALIVLLSSIISMWWLQAIKPPDPSDSTPVIFTIKRGESLRSIADGLQKEGLIRSSVAMFILGRFGGLSEKIQSGDFRLNRKMDLPTVAQNLTHGTQDIWITIPEGWRKEEIALRLAKELSIPESEFNKTAKEGYMFPETYLLPKETTAESASKLFLETFNKKIAELDKDKIRKKGLSPDQLVIIASLVEREAKYDVDRPLIASVILNRLKIGMKLDIDATIQYALGYQPKEKSWWKKELTIEDLATDSPYNTYRNPGLPPGPIANPGLAVLKAVTEAPDTDYLFYIADNSGQSHFARNIEEHNSNISKYLGK